MFCRRASCFLLVLLVAGSAWAAPTLRVRARTRLVLDSLQRSPSGVVVLVGLVDALTGEGLPGRAVAISADGAAGFYRYAEPTDGAGRVEFRVPLNAGEYDLRIAAGSDADHAPPDALTHHLDLGRRLRCLTAQVPPSLPVDATALSIQITATDCDLVRGFAPPTDSLFRVDADGQEVASGRLSSGRATVEIPRHRLGPPGRKVEVRVVLPPDPRFAESSTSTEVAIPVAASLELTAAEPRDDGYVVRGRLAFDPVGVQSGTVSLFEAGDSEASHPAIARLAVPGPGSFEFPRVELAAGSHELHALFAPHSSLLVGATSAGLPLVVRPPVPTGWLLPPLIALGLGALSALLSRRNKLAAAARAWTTARRRDRSSDPGRADQVGLGLELVVRDAVRRTPLPRVEVRSEAGVHLTDAQGRVHFEAAPSFVECSPPGYRLRRLELGGQRPGSLVLDLISVRELAYGEFLAAAQRLGRGLSVDGERASPRQILEQLAHKAILLDPLPQLVDELERLYFGASAPPGAALEALAARLAAVAPASPSATPLDPRQPRSL